MRRRLVSIVALLLLVLGCLALAGWAGLLRRFAPPDVVFITIDTLRVDHVGAFAPDSPSATPHIDALAADGVRYTQAWSPISVTGPAFVSLMTGQEPARHGVLMNLFRGGNSLSREHRTLAERLRRQRGHATGAFVSGFTLRPGLGLAHGFQVYDAPTAQELRRPGSETTDRALAWLDQLPRWQWMMLWFHSYDTHGPLTPYTQRAPAGPQWTRDPDQLDHVPAYQRIDGISDPDFYEQRYAEGVELADAEVGRVVDALKRSGRYQHALVIFAADHGESFTERPLWFDHGTHASPEQLHVPLIVKYPRGRDAGASVDALVSLLDLLPTVVQTVGLEVPARAMDGQVLPSPGQAPPADRALLGESSHCKQKEVVMDCAPLGIAGKELALRSADRTVLRESTKAGLRWRVYDRHQDPLELGEGMAGDAGEPGADSRALLQAAAAERGAQAGAQQAAEQAVEAQPEDPEETEALRALGYVE